MERIGVARLWFLLALPRRNCEKNVKKMVDAIAGTADDDNRSSTAMMSWLAAPRCFGMATQ